MAQLQPGSQSGYHNRGGELLDPAGPPVVDEDDVDVAVRGELLAAVAAHRDQGDGPLADAGKRASASAKSDLRRSSVAPANAADSSRPPIVRSAISSSRREVTVVAIHEG